MVRRRYELEDLVYITVCDVVVALSLRAQEKCSVEAEVREYIVHCRVCRWIKIKGCTVMAYGDVERRIIRILLIQGILLVC